MSTAPGPRPGAGLSWWSQSLGTLGQCRDLGLSPVLWAAEV